MPNGGPGAQPRRWPPTAVRDGVDLTTGAVLGIFLGMEVAGYLAWTMIVGRPFSVVGWEWDPTTTAVTRQLIENSAIQLALWLGVLMLLGWRRPAGLVVGSASLWGIVPLGLFWAAALMAAGLTDVISKGGGFILLAVVGVFLAALNEEVAFRGFLFHGLTARLGGRIAVLLGSALFALSHLPVEVGGRRHPTPVIVGVLLMHFCSGVALCRIRAETRAVWIPAGVHALYNLTTVAFAIWAPSDQVPAAFVLLKLGFAATGLLLGVGLVKRRRAWRDFRANVAILSSFRRADLSGIERTGTQRAGTSENRRGSGDPAAGSIFGRFTAAARLAVILAQEEARMRGDPAIGTEHLLLGLIADRQGIPMRALERLGVSPATGAADRLMDPEDAAPRPHLPLTPRSKLAIVIAIREADRLGHVEIDPGHLLLGVVADRQGEAARVLRRLGVPPSRMRHVLVDMMASRTEPGDVPLVPGDRSGVAPIRPGVGWRDDGA
jgi:membrane protease YdiL (CAAX protease family)